MDDRILSKLGWLMLGSGLLMAAVGLALWFGDTFIGIFMLVAGLIETVVGAVMFDLAARRQTKH